MLPLNLILYGPPGTGKTYRLQNEFFPLFTEAGKKRYTVVTFHQSYGYEEFIEGLRPRTENGQLVYEVLPGAFRTICEQARSDPEHRYAIFIDEINRGNISKIFGELLTLIEDDKRAQTDSNAPISVELAYSKQEFSVPGNLHIIGTMNTADRSIAMLDTALRRRFSFQEMLPEYAVINREVGGINLARLLQKLNTRIEYLYDREHVIGHAYLTSVRSLADLCRCFQQKITPLIQEYFFDDWAKVCAVLNCPADSEDDSNRHPLILVKTLEPPKGQNQAYGKRYSYSINPDFSPLSPDLKSFFEGLMS